jgi:hypothetical protein
MTSYGIASSNEERIRFLTEKMFPLFEWFEIMKKDELEHYCHLVAKGTSSSKRIWDKMLQIYYQIYLREKLYAAAEYGYKQ